MILDIFLLEFLVDIQVEILGCEAHEKYCARDTDFGILGI